MVALAAPAIAEAPLPVQDVGRDDRDDARDHLGGHRLGLENRQLQGVENRRVDDERGAADDGEFDQFVMALRIGLDDPGQARDCGIGEGHNTPVYGRTRKRRKMLHNDCGVTAGQHAAGRRDTMMAVPSTRPPKAAPLVAMVGGGQLARMTHQAAIALGQTLRVLATAADEPAAQVSPDVVIGSHTDLEDLRRVAAGADALTFDHEHVPTELLEKLVAEGVNVAPPPQALVHAQDKLVMRRRLEALGAPVPRYAGIENLDDAGCLRRARGRPAGGQGGPGRLRRPRRADGARPGACPRDRRRIPGRRGAGAGRGAGGTAPRIVGAGGALAVRPGRGVAGGARRCSATASACW